MTSLFVLDTPENRPVVEVAQRDQSVVVHRVGPYFELSCAAPISTTSRLAASSESPRAKR